MCIEEGKGSIDFCQGSRSIQEQFRLHSPYCASVVVIDFRSGYLFLIFYLFFITSWVGADCRSEWRLVSRASFPRIIVASPVAPRSTGRPSVRFFKQQLLLGRKKTLVRRHYESPSAHLRRLPLSRSIVFFHSHHECPRASPNPRPSPIMIFSPQHVTRIRFYAIIL